MGIFSDPALNPKGLLTHVANVPVPTSSLHTLPLSHRQKFYRISKLVGQTDGVALTPTEWRGVEALPEFAASKAAKKIKDIKDVIDLTREDRKKSKEVTKTTPVESILHEPVATVKPEPVSPIEPRKSAREIAKEKKKERKERNVQRKREISAIKSDLQKKTKELHSKQKEHASEGSSKMDEYFHPQVPQNWEADNWDTSIFEGTGCNKVVQKFHKHLLSNMHGHLKSHYKKGMGYREYMARVKRDSKEILDNAINKTGSGKFTDMLWKYGPGVLSKAGTALWNWWHKKPSYADQLRKELDNPDLEPSERRYLLNELAKAREKEES